MLRPILYKFLTQIPFALDIEAPQETSISEDKLPPD